MKVCIYGAGAIGGMLAAPRRSGAMLGRIDNQAIALVALAIVVIAITESGEEARFQIGLLPLIALAPMPVLLAPDGTRRRLSRRGRYAALATLTVVVATTELLVSGAVRQPMPALAGGRVAPNLAPTPGPTFRVAQFNVRGGAWRDRDAEMRATAACLQGIDIAGNRPRRWTEAQVQEADVVVTMGCGDTCPYAPGTRYEDWPFEDPAFRDLDAVRHIRDLIRDKVHDLLDELDR